MLKFTLRNDNGKQYETTRGLGRKAHAVKAENALHEMGTYTFVMENGDELVIDIVKIPAAQKVTIMRHTDGFRGFGWVVDDLIKEMIDDERFDL